MIRRGAADLFGNNYSNFHTNSSFLFRTPGYSAGARTAAGLPKIGKPDSKRDGRDPREIFFVIERERGNLL